MGIWWGAEEVGHTSSNVTNMSCAPTCTVLNIWQVSMVHPCVSWRLLLRKKLVSLDKLTFQPRSTPVKPASSEALLLLLINQKSVFQANQGFTCLFFLSGFEIRLRKSFMTKYLRSNQVYYCVANLCRNANFSHVHMTYHDVCPTSSGLWVCPHAQLVIKWWCTLT